MALLLGGGYAEEAVVHAGSAMPVPATLSDDEAGAIPEVFLTAFLNIFMLGQAADGGAVLVHGGGSGVGTAATTLCKLAGMHVIVTAGSDDKCERCRRHGADVAINYRNGSFAAAVREASGGTGVGVILDCVGGRYLEPNLECLALDGRLVVIGLIGGARAEINLAGLLMKRQSVIGSTLRSRSNADKAALVSAFRSRFGSALEQGQIRPVIDRVLAAGAGGGSASLGSVERALRESRAARVKKGRVSSARDARSSAQVRLEPSTPRSLDPLPISGRIRSGGRS